MRTSCRSGLRSTPVATRPRDRRPGNHEWRSSCGLRLAPRFRPCPLTDANNPLGPLRLTIDAALDFTLQQLCDLYATTPDIAGTSITLATPQDGNGASASSKAFAGITDIQFTLGEGPEIDAITTMDIVVVSSAAEMAQRWPSFFASALDYGIGSTIALPLRMGAISLGALTLYYFEEKAFDDTAIRLAITVSRTATLTLLAQQDAVSHLPSSLSPTATIGYRAVVHQATGMVAAQLNCDIAEALVRLRAHAYANQCQITDVAQAIVRRELRLKL